eukprot:CAMPEP_0174320620 /NCGR_PEP_ID=MMETSP0810-20121108/9694_1 /TAXON_ID=73025 ORGANISM="Eutreptiella gymnastica-like, Strain CCMP1594" /NCGR_SAMPLE_ID=MMETSP0810 /ASSEMBLY_ACC=CAM_ASM_000659 /LENGTH=122 /DNA_ID=CAMNT_0015431639 /DNA_START=596 /DNA_END=960 /DNA_ORIENTATION=-
MRRIISTHPMELGRRTVDETRSPDSECACRTAEDYASSLCQNTLTSEIVLLRDDAAIGGGLCVFHPVIGICNAVHHFAPGHFLPENTACARLQVLAYVGFRAVRGAGTEQAAESRRHKLLHE